MPSKVPALLDVMKAIAQATPSGSVVSGLAQAVQDREERRWQQFVNDMFAAIDLELEALGDRFSQQHIEELVHHGLRCSAEATRDEQVRLLARIVADGVTSGSELDVDKTHMLLEMAAGLEPMHLRILQWIGPMRTVTGKALMPKGGKCDVQSLEVRLPDLAGLVGPLVAVLESRGLLRRHDFEDRGREQTPRKEPVWSLTEFGRDLLAYLEQLGDS